MTKRKKKMQALAASSRRYAQPPATYGRQKARVGSDTPAGAGGWVTLPANRTVDPAINEPEDGPQWLLDHEAAGRHHDATAIVDHLAGRRIKRASLCYECEHWTTVRKRLADAAADETQPDEMRERAKRRLGQRLARPGAQDCLSSCNGCWYALLREVHQPRPKVRVVDQPAPVAAGAVAGVKPTYGWRRVLVLTDIRQDRAGLHLGQAFVRELPVGEIVLVGPGVTTQIGGRR